MEDEKVIIEVDIDTSNVITDIENLNKEVAKLTSELTKLTEAENKDTKAIIAKQAELKAAKSEVNSLTTTLVKLTKAEKDEGITINKLEAENRKLRESIKNLDITDKEYKKTIDEVNKKINENTALISENSDKFKQDKINVGNYKDSIIEAADALGVMGEKGSFIMDIFKGGGALTAIPLIASGIRSLFDDIMQRSQKLRVQINTTLQQFTSTLSLGFGMVVEEVMSGKQAKSFSEATQRATEAFKKFNEEREKNNLLIELNVLSEELLRDAYNDNILQIGSYQRNIDLLNAKLSNGNLPIEQQIRLQEELRNQRSALAKEQENQLQKQLEIEDRRLRNTKKILGEEDLRYKEALLKRNELYVEFQSKQNEQDIIRLESEAQIMSLRQDMLDRELDYLIDHYDRIKTQNETIVNNDQYTLAKRKEALKEFADLGVQTWQQQQKTVNDFYKTQIDFEKLLAETNSKKVVNLLQSFGINDRGQGRILEMLNEERIKRSDLAEATLTLRKYEADQNVNILQKEIKKRQDALTQEKELLGKSLGEKLTQRANDYNDEIDKINRIKAAKQELADFERELNQYNDLTIFEQRAADLENRYNYEKQLAQDNGLDTANIDKKYSKVRKMIWLEEQQYKADIASTIAGNIATIFGENTALGKAAGVAQVAIDTYRGSMAAYASAMALPFPANIIAAVAGVGAVVAQGIMSTKKILSVNEGSTVDGSGATSSATSSAASATQSVITASPTVGNGIVNRNVQSQVIQPQAQYMPVLVVDEVTYNQNKQSEISSVAVI